MLGKRRARVAVGLASLLFALPADAADEPNVCTDAYEGAQTLMRPGSNKLLPAREALRTCMRSGCKDWMVADCSKWLGEVEARIPTVVFSAKNTAGRELADAAVSTASGQALASTIDGRAVEIDPGQHTFVFKLPDGTEKGKTALVREGEKAQSVSILFDASPEELAQLQERNSAQSAGGAAVERRPSTLRYVGFAAAGLGAVGLALGAVFGATALSKKNSACDDQGLCDSQTDIDDAKSAASIATVGFVAGGILLAGGVTLAIFAPSTTVRVGPQASLGPGRAGFGLGGTW